MVTAAEVVALPIAGRAVDEGQEFGFNFVEGTAPLLTGSGAKGGRVRQGAPGRKMPHRRQRGARQIKTITSGGQEGSVGSFGNRSAEEA